MHHLKKPQNYDMIKMILAGSLELSIIIYQEYKQVMVVKKRESEELLCDYVSMLKFIYADLAGDLITQC